MRNKLKIILSLILITAQLLLNLAVYFHIHTENESCCPTKCEVNLKNNSTNSSINNLIEKKTNLDCQLCILKSSILIYFILVIFLFNIILPKYKSSILSKIFTSTSNFLNYQNRAPPVLI